MCHYILYAAVNGVLVVGFVFVKLVLSCVAISSFYLLISNYHFIEQDSTHVNYVTLYYG